MSATADFEQDDGGTAALHAATCRWRGSATCPTGSSGSTARSPASTCRASSRIDTVGAWVVHRFAARHDAAVEGLDEDGAASVRSGRRAPTSRSRCPPGRAGGVQPRARRDRRRGGRSRPHAATACSASSARRRSRSGTSSATRAASASTPTVQRFEVVGVSALGIVGLMSFLIGIVIAQQGAVQLRQFGAEVFTINLVGRLTLRELGVLMTAIMVAGRSGIGLRGAARHDEADRGDRRDAHDRRVADGGAGAAAHARGDRDDAAARLLRLA